MAKNLKLNIKNTQTAQAINLTSLKSKLAEKKAASSAPAKDETIAKGKKTAVEEAHKEEAPKQRSKARSKSAFAPQPEHGETQTANEELVVETPLTQEVPVIEDRVEELHAEENPVAEVEPVSPIVEKKVDIESIAPPPMKQKPAPRAPARPPVINLEKKSREQAAAEIVEHHKAHNEPRIKLGPTGKHINDILPPARPKVMQTPPPKPAASAERRKTPQEQLESENKTAKAKTPFGANPVKAALEEADAEKKGKTVKEFRDIKPTRKVAPSGRFDTRDRQGLRDTEDDGASWRRRKQPKIQKKIEDLTIRPTELKVRIPISIKDLALEMKLKASELIAKLFLQGMIVTLNDLLSDETTIQLLGHEFGCEIAIDTAEEERVRITDKTIKEEIDAIDESELAIRPPVVAFMGHVDHGKTSLIDAIRKSNRVSGEAGAITQHIGAFRCHTAVGDIAILDTPGHEAFSAMRARGADVTDIVVLVVAGDEGIRQQTIEAIQHAKAAGVTIVIAINKCDKPNFNPDTVYRQLADQDLLPEAWGGQAITVNCSAVTGEGIQSLLEMLALQAEVLELKASPSMRARGTVLESEMHKGMGPVATVLVQNGTLRKGDSLVFGSLWCKVKTMRNEFGKELEAAGPSTPVEITGLSGLSQAGQEFIVVKSEKEAREIAEARMLDAKQTHLHQAKRMSVDNLFQQASDTSAKKILNIVLRADVQGSLEALKAGLEKIESEKAALNIIFAAVGEVSESDIQLAAASKAVVIGFHTAIESHADNLVKEMGVQVRLHDIIYHAIDDVKSIMSGLLDKVSQEIEKGKAEVRATFKSSQHGLIAGCMVIEGTIERKNHIRVMRQGQMVWKGPIASIKRVKEDVKEVSKGVECGILISKFSDFKEGDILEAFEIVYLTQEL